MARVAVLMAEGYEEGETLTIVDLLRRAGIECHTFSFDNEFVKGMHNMYVQADKMFGKEVQEYDMIVLPGGVQVEQILGTILTLLLCFSILMSIINILQQCAQERLL